MRITQILLGGGRHFHYPKSVWSPAGGWYVLLLYSYISNQFLYMLIVGGYPSNYELCFSTLSIILVHNFRNS